MEPKNILIFGAGINQLTLIQACNDLGHRSIVIDPNDNAPGRSFANVFEVVAPDDFERTKQVAVDYNVYGIATSQMENPLRLMAKLADELGFIFNSPEIIEGSLNKHLMKQAFIAKNIPHAKGIYLSNKNDLTKEKLKGFEFPLILKPADSHSSRGVYRIESFKHLFDFIEETLSFSRSGSFLIEEFIDGPEFSIESVTFKGKTEVIQYTEKIITPFPNVVELGHIQPADLSDIEKKEIEKVVIKGIEALGLDNTVTHTEVKLNKSGPVIIEIGPRMAGDFISSYLVKHSSGVDLDKATILMAIGEQPNLKPTINNYSYIRYLQLPAGKTVKEINDLEMIFEKPGVVFAHLNIKKGDIISKITDSAKRPGFIIVEGKSKKEVEKRVGKYLQFIEEQIILN